MLAIDTNVVVRFLTADEPAQAAKARALIANHDVFVAATVLLETYWVLVSAYDFEEGDAIDKLVDFAGLPHVMLDDPQRLAAAFVWARDGMDFADALHLSAADACEAFATFDRRLVKRATKAGVPVRVP